jgi:hypothetical protein
MSDSNALTNSNNNTPQGKLLDSNKNLNLSKGSGPYIGTVMGPVDDNFMGKLMVWVPDVSNTDQQDIKGWVPCSYASPFYGITNLVNPDDPADVTNTSQSYGMWFVPPDVGVQVLVVFANNDPSKGFWVACIPSQLQNHMIPGIAHRGATTKSAPTLEPVTEYNKNKLKGPATPNTTTANPDVTPSHLLQQTVLDTQGLSGDQARGVTTSSARRETPSNVYGISTPGPVVKRKNSTPGTGIDYNTVTGRKGGHQFVMDDGDLEGHNQLIRIRSSNGGQVLINDSIGAIYVINQQGTAWIEMTNGGRIDVYGKDAISLHSETDINLTADNNINMLASNSFNLVSPSINLEGVDIKMQGKGSIRNKTPNYIISADSITFNTANGAGGGASSSPGTGIRMSSSQAVEIVADGNLYLQAGANIEQVATGKIIMAASGNLALNADGQLQLNGVGGIYEETKAGAGTIAKFTVDVDKDFTGGDHKGNVHPVTGWTGAKNWFDGAADKPSHSLQAQRTSEVVDIPKPYTSGKDSSHIEITPQHEPWSGHEVLFKGGGGGASAAAVAPSTGAGSGSPTSSIAPTATTSTATVSTSSSNSGAAAGSTQTSSPSAPETPASINPPQPPSSQPSGSPSEAIATVSESSLPDGAPTTATGGGYNIKSITTVASVAGFVEPQLPVAMAQMIADIGIDWAPFREACAARLSNGRYTVVNDKGRLGRYTVGPKTLFKFGILNTELDSATATKAQVSDPGIWTTPDQELKSAFADNKAIFSNPGSPQLAPGSLEGYLKDTALQEKIFLHATHYTYTLYYKYGLFTDTTPKSEIAGWMATWLLAGPGEFNKLPGKKFIYGNGITSAQLQTAISGPMGGGLAGLFAWWKLAGNDPTQAPGLDPLGKNAYSYYLIGSQSQPAGQLKTIPR